VVDEGVLEIEAANVPLASLIIKSPSLPALSRMNSMRIANGDSAADITDKKMGILKRAISRSKFRVSRSKSMSFFSL